MAEKYCPGSGHEVYLTWNPTANYRGGVICLKCSLGMEITTEPKVDQDDELKRMYVKVPKHHAVSQD